MASALDSSHRATPPAKSAERRFFTYYAFGLVALAFLGFARSFYLRWLLPPFLPVPPLDLLSVVHGFAASVFILLYPVQTWLIANGRWALHKRIGNWAFAYAVLLLPLIYFMASGTFHRPGPTPPPFRVISTILPLSFVLLLAVLLALAWRYRFDGQAHKRLMIAIACVFIAPAIARIPLALLVPGPLRILFYIVVTQSLMLAALLPLWIWDWRTRRGFHWATLLGTGLFALVLAGRIPLASTSTWAMVVAMLPGFGTP